MSVHAAAYEVRISGKRALIFKTLVVLCDWQVDNVRKTMAYRYKVRRGQVKIYRMIESGQVAWHA